MISGLLNLSLNRKTNIIFLWRHQDTQQNLRTLPSYFQKYYVGICWKSGKSKNGEDGRRQFPTIRLIKS